MRCSQTTRSARTADPLERRVAYEFKLPDLGEGLTEGEIARWLVEEGQEIAEDAPLVEIATDKTTVEIPSPAGGTVSRILVAEGEVVPVGTVLVVIGGDAGSSGPVPVSDTETRPKETARPARSSEETKVRATPLRPQSGSGTRSRPQHGNRHRPAGPDHGGGCARCCCLFRPRPGNRYRDRSRGDTCRAARGRAGRCSST